MAAVLFLLNLIYGLSVISDSVSGRAVRVAVVQGNIEQAKKWDQRYAAFIMDVYADLTQKAAASQPQLIIWPETATPRSISSDPQLYHRVKAIAAAAQSPLLLGSSQLQKFKVNDLKSAKYINSAYLITPSIGSNDKQRYDKIRLFPFGEYLPYKQTIPWSFINIPEIAAYIPGNNYTVFTLPHFQFGVTICWENLFSGLVRQFVRQGAQLIINITNEAWFGETAAPYQFLSMSVLRAVENGRYVIRCANTGISCFIDSHGRIVKRLQAKNGKDVFIRGILVGSIVPITKKTFYTSHGDWMVWISIFIACAILILSVLRKKEIIL